MFLIGIPIPFVIAVFMLCVGLVAGIEWIFRGKSVIGRWLDKLGYREWEECSMVMIPSLWWFQLMLGKNHLTSRDNRV